MVARQIRDKQDCRKLLGLECMGCAEATPEAQAPATARLVEAVRFELRFVYLVWCVLAYKNVGTQM